MTGCLGFLRREAALLLNTDSNGCHLVEKLRQQTTTRPTTTRCFGAGLLIYGKLFRGWRIQMNPMVPFRTVILSFFWVKSPNFRKYNWIHWKYFREGLLLFFCWRIAPCGKGGDLWSWNKKRGVCVFSIEYIRKVFGGTFYLRIRGVFHQDKVIGFLTGISNLVTR